MGTDINCLLFLTGHPGSEIVQGINLVCGSSYLHGFNHAPMKPGQQFFIPVKTIGEKMPVFIEHSLKIAILTVIQYILPVGIICFAVAKINDCRGFRCVHSVNKHLCNLAGHVAGDAAVACILTIKPIGTDCRRSNRHGSKHIQKIRGYFAKGERSAIAGLLV